MRQSLLRRPLVQLSFLAACVFAAGCEDKAPPKVTPVASASSDALQGPVLDGRLGEEVAGIAKGTKNPPPKSSAAVDGPPPTGIFEAGGADRAHAKGAPAKVEVLGDGNEPRIQLAASRPEGRQEAVMVVAIASGQQQALPPMAVRLLIHEEGKDGDKKKKSAAAPAPSAAADAPAAPPGPMRVVAELTDATVAAGPGTNVPKQLTEAFAKLKGSTFTWAVGPEGPGPVDHKMAKGGEEGLDIALEAVEEALSEVLIAVPNKPVGEGAHWMVTDRSTSMGLDSVRYRHVTVSKVDGDRATLSIEVRKYGVNDKLDLPLGPQMSSASLEKVEASGKVTLVLLPRAFVADTAEVSSKLFAALVPPGGRNPGAQQQQRMQVQLEVMGQLRSPEALAAAAREQGGTAPAPGKPATPSPSGPGGP